MDTTPAADPAAPLPAPAATAPDAGVSLLDEYDAETERRRRRALRFLFGSFVVALGLVVLIGWLVDGGTSSDDLPVIDAQLTTLDGEPFVLSELRGTPVVVNFFASWCAPCRAELPDFERVHQQLGDEVTFVGVNSSETDVDAARELLTETGVTFQVGLGDDGSLVQEVGGTVMPTTAFLDAEGRLVAIHGGALTAAELTLMIGDELTG